jgi:hypothetical protein
MPTILRELGISFSFFASDGKEPPRVHVWKGDNQARWWLAGSVGGQPKEAWNDGFNRADRARIARIVALRREDLLQAWNAYFGHE